MLPLAVILSLPVGLFGTFGLLQVTGLANDVYAQIGLVMLVGLLGKNAILIVEFAVQRRHEGLSLKEAAIEGGKLRFRPILMTSFAFIAGLLPLVVATGPGAIGNRTIGTAAVGGMLVGTSGRGPRHPRPLLHLRCHLREGQPDQGRGGRTPGRGRRGALNGAVDSLIRPGGRPIGSAHPLGRRRRPAVGSTNQGDRRRGSPLPRRRSPLVFPRVVGRSVVPQGPGRPATSPAPR